MRAAILVCCWPPLVSVPAAENDPALHIQPADRITVAGNVEIRPAQAPRGLRFEPELGVLVAEPLNVRRLHAWPAPKNFIEAPRSLKTPAGDYLVMFVAGSAHYGWNMSGVQNEMVAYRSSDRGETWSGPTVPWKVPYSQHGFIPLVPRGSRTIHAFGTVPITGQRTGSEDCPIGFRTSEDDGRTWSEVTLIRPANDPDFRGMSLMRMCETEDGTWLLGSHTADRTSGLKTRQYVLRSTDRGQTWQLLPGPRPAGWTLPQFGRMEEGRAICLGGNRALLLMRTMEGHLWESRSDNAGLTWSQPRATPLVHPDAPAMIFHLADGKTLAALHHNRPSRGTAADAWIQGRSELWISLSTDDGRTWSEPRFLLANAAEPNVLSRGQKVVSVSYDDILVDGENLHLFVDFQVRQVLHVRFRQSDLETLPTREDLTRLVAKP